MDSLCVGFLTTGTMTISNLLPRLSAVALALSLAACSGAHRLDATSEETLKTSMDLARTGFLTQAELDRFDQARAHYEATYLQPDATIASNPYLPEWDIVHGMRAGEFLRFVDGLQRSDQRNQPADTAPTFPNAALTSRLLEQYQLERTLLVEARERIQESGKNTINEYPIVDFAFIPPRADLPMEFDKARFIVTLRNDSGFDAYRPSFTVVIRDPNEEIPLLERAFEFEKLEEPIGPGETKMLEMSCCGISSDPYHNRILKQLSEDALIEVNLTSVMNHGTTPILDTQGFAMKDFLRLGVVTRCIKQIEGQVGTWVPRAEADAPGGCGDGTGSESELGLAHNP